MKKILSLILVFGILLSALSFGTVGAQAVECDYYYTISNNKVTITNVSSPVSGEVIIPATIEGCDVVRISRGVFHGNESITAVTIPDSVENIDWGAFYLCSNLKSVDFGNGVKSIGQEAFYGCDSLESVVIPDSVESIDKEAFASCDSLESVTIGNGVVDMGTYTFFQCKGLKNVIIGNGVKNIGEYTFYECENLESVILGNNVESIGSHAFCSCKSLIDITFPNSVKSICNGAFFECNSFKNLKIGNCVESIETYAFYSCESLESITFSDSITSVGEYAFSECDNFKSLYITDLEKWCKIDFAAYGANPLEDAKYFYINNEIVTDVVVPNGITKIPTFAFSCETLKSVSIPGSVSSIDARAFNDCKNLTDVWYGGSELDVGNINIVYGNNALLNAEWHYGICEEHEFSSADCLAQCNNCEWKKPHTEYVIKYDNKNHWKECTDCNGKVHIEYHEDLAYTENADGQTHKVDCVCGYKEESEPHFFVFKNYADAFGGYYACGCGANPTTKEGALTYIIEDGEAIITKAESDITGEVRIPAEIKGCPVVGIGGSAFQYCSGITGVTIPNSVTYIGLSAFEECSALSNVVLGDGIKSIGNSSFYGCSRLKNVWYVGSQSDRENIVIDSWNNDFENASWQYDYDITCLHEWENATCTVAKTCKLCGIKEGVANGHTYIKYVPNNDATCTKDGTKTAVCEYCDATNTTIDYKKGHVSDNGTVTKKATCTATGTKTYKCTVCEEVVNTEKIDKIAHSYKSATCTKLKTCKDCGKTTGNALGHKYEDKVTKATTSKNGKTYEQCERCDKVTNEKTIYKIASIKLKATKLTFNGKTQKPTIVVKDSKGKTISSSYYTLSGDKSGKAIDKYKVKVAFKGKYSGTRTLSYEIVKPTVKKSSISKLTAAKKSLKVSIKKASSVTGYEIEYSTSKSFKSSKKKTTTKTSYTIKSLSAKKTYYVRVRSYKTVGGKKFYSDWSSYKYKKTK